MSSSSKDKQPIDQCCNDVESNERCDNCKDEHRLSNCKQFKDVVNHFQHIAKILSEIEKDYEHDPKTCRLFKNTANNLERIRIQFAKFK